jgi:23S rRNA pseudouridine1911/1915/1917 synthase
MNGVLEKEFTPAHYRLLCEVTREYGGMRIDKFVQLHFPSFSRQFIHKKIALNEITFIGRHLTHHLKPSLKVLKGDRIQVICPFDPTDVDFWKGAPVDLDYELPVIYEDGDVMAVNKPPFMITHPAGRHIFHCATVIAENKMGTPIHSLHRLDRETSGLLLLGKNSHHSNILSNMFEDRMMKKVYFFIAHTEKSYNSGDTFVANESIGPKQNYERHLIMETFPEGDDRGKPSETRFHILFQNQHYTLGLAFPHTGRQHQIRVHAAHHGLPLLGDKLYSGDFEVFFRLKERKASDADYERLILPRQALHALGLKIGVGPEELKVRDQFLFAPVAKDLEEWIYETFNQELAKIKSIISIENLHSIIENYFNTLR